MRWSEWRSHFEDNAGRPLPPVAVDGAVPESWRSPLAASLAIFQAGEAGEGRIAREIDDFRAEGIDSDYRASLKLFVKEEGRHARLLAAAVRALGGELLERPWSERLFVHARRLAGVDAKLLCLLTAEVLGIGFYELVAGRLPVGGLRRTLAEIAADEACHLRFHADFFRLRARTPARAAVFRAAWRAVATAATTLVLADHAGNLRAIGSGPGELASRYRPLVARVEREVLGAVGAGEHAVVAAVGAGERAGALRRQPWRQGGAQE